MKTNYTLTEQWYLDFDVYVLLSRIELEAFILELWYRKEFKENCNVI